LSQGSSQDDEPRVVDATRWLFEHVERLLEREESTAIPYLERLLVATAQPEMRIYCLKNLGVLHLAAGELGEARKYLRAAIDLSPSDPELHHALGKIAIANGQFWLALIEFMEALHHGREEEVVAFMRAVANTMRQLQFGEIAVAVLLGAAERSPDDPWVLDSLARVYEAEERWLDAIAARESLVDVLDQQRALGPTTPVAVRADLERLSARMREGMRLTVDDERPTGDFDVQRTNSPAGLHTLVEALGLRDHNFALLATGEALWARAVAAKLDIHLEVTTLAAAVHWVVERLHWRVPTTLEELAALYRADAERLPAAVRLVVACLDVRLVPTEGPRPELAPDDRDRLEKLQRAILFGVSVDEVEAKAMLGDPE
jgi:tetratricopeptide (TPR) repeat protein